MPRGRVRVENGSVVSDCGSLLRGGTVKVYAQGHQTGKTAYATEAAYYRQIRQARLNAVRIICLDPWKRSQGQFHWDFTNAADRSALLSALDCVVELACEHELYALIDYHDIGAYDLAQLESFWEIVAPRYATLSHVFYELANEPVSWTPEQYTDQALREQEGVYRRLRELAPQTHVVLLSFANTAGDLVPRGNPMLNVVERMSGVDWGNASVSVHPYRTLSSENIVALRQRVPVMVTELDLPAHAGSSDEPHIYTFLDGAEYAHQALERLGVSWFGWGIEGPRKLDKYFRRGVLMDASAKGYLWKPDWPERKAVADYSSVAGFFRDYPVAEAARQMGFEWQHLAGLAALACAAALMEGIMLWALLPISQGLAQGNFGFFWRTALVRPLGPWLPSSIQTYTGTLLVFATGLFLIGLIKSRIHYALYVAAGRYYGIYSAGLTDFIARRYLEFGKAYFDRRGALNLRAAVNHSQQFMNLLKDLLREILGTPVLILYFSIMSIISWPSALLVLLAAGASHWFERGIANHAARRAANLRANALAVSAQPARLLKAIPLLRIFGSADEAGHLHAAIVERARKSDSEAWRLDGIRLCAREVTMLLAVLLIAFAAVMNTGHAPLLTIVVLFFLASLALPRLNTFFEVEREFGGNRSAMREFFDIFNDNGKYILPSGPRAFEGLAESVEFRNLTFAYPERKPVLHDVSFVVRKGEMTVLVGPEGSGKSTLAALLLRYYDAPPRTIFLDSVYLRKFTTSSLRRNIALVSQDIPLLDDTLGNNLIFGLEGAFADCDFTRISREAFLEELIESLPNGLDTKIGDAGVTLSGGDRQRVAIARALLQRAPVVIVDEIGCLGGQAEEGLPVLLERLTRDCTSLVITSRMSIIKRANNVVVLDQGRVIEEGSPRELLFRRGRFFRMWAAKQFQ